jgi:hemoglobin-like flavoprotein
MMPAWCGDALDASVRVAPGERALEPEHAMLRRTGAVVASDPRTFGACFYRRLFARAPALRALFPADLQAQELKLAGMVAHLLDSLERRETLAQTLGELGQRHRGYGATFVHYLAVGEALIEALAECNGADFDAPARLAWARLYSWVVYRMRYAGTERADRLGAITAQAC